jgi:hypothetical protein
MPNSNSTLEAVSCCMGSLSFVKLGFETLGFRQRLSWQPQLLIIIKPSLRSKPS